MAIINTKTIPKEWKKVRLGDVCNFINGKTPLRSRSEYWQNGNIPWFTVDDIRTQGRIITKTNQLISEIGLKESGLKIVPKDTLLLCCTASIGEYAFTKIELTTNQQFNALVSKDKNKLSPYYLYAIAPILKKQLENIMGTTTFGFVSLGKLGLIEIFLPSLNEQTKISEILSEVDNKININKQIKNKLAELKKGLMRDLLSGRVRTEV
ncbi:MAG: restriction endonuclease subunit S [bacterium]|nr:restriction endonuclease subunit S [bacterium]